MSLIPDNNKLPLGINLMPMIDFLFLLLSFFAILAISRSALIESEIDLVKFKKQSAKQPSSYQVNVGILKNGQYKWLTQDKSIRMNNIESIKKELLYQYEQGYLPTNKQKTKILLHIDKNAPWDAIAKLIVELKNIGFDSSPVYQDNI